MPPTLLLTLTFTQSTLFKNFTRCITSSGLSLGCLRYLSSGPRLEQDGSMTFGDQVFIRHQTLRQRLTTRFLADFWTSARCCRSQKAQHRTPLLREINEYDCLCKTVRSRPPGQAETSASTGASVVQECAQTPTETCPTDWSKD